MPSFRSMQNWVIDLEEDALAGWGKGLDNDPPAQESPLATIMVTLELITDQYGYHKICTRFDAVDVDHPVTLLTGHAYMFRPENNGHWAMRNYTFESARTGRTWTSRSSRISKKSLGIPFSPESLIQLPAIIEHDIPEGTFEDAAAELDLKEGDELLIRLNKLDTCQINFWALDYADNIKHRLLYPYSLREHARVLSDEFGKNVEIGEDSRLLQWDLSRAFVTVQL